jgi:acyl-[acyl-carrier-protein]-phospholipid O-acyltransferase / long-chain-fatty-acid--[acyl-carrier-protein] ligase
MSDDKTGLSPTNRGSAGAWCFFVAVFLNAFVDLGHKITIQNTLFKLYSGTYQVIMTALINALILLPFILLLTPSGDLSDRYNKLRIMRTTGWGGIAICLVIVFCYYMGWFMPAFAMTLLLATQSAIYSPAKYGFIKEFFGKQQLGEVNGIVSALAIVSILLGTLAFSITFEGLYPEGAQTEAEVLRAMAPSGWLLVIGSALETFLLYRIPLDALRTPAEPLPPLRKVHQWYGPGQLRANLEPLINSRAIRLSAIGLSVFWAVGQVMLAAFPAFLKDNLGVENTIVVQGIIASSGLGIAFGSMYAGRFSRNYIETGLLPLGAVGIAVGLLMLPYVDSTTLAAILFFFIGIMGGIFIVPLNALIQYFAGESALGRTLAASNWMQNIAMLLFLLLTVVFALLGWSSKALLQLIAVVAFVGSIYTLYELPQSLTRFILSRVVNTRYRIKVQGMRHIPAQGGVLLLGNHVSWIDWAIVQIASPRPVRFVMIESIYRLWYLNWFFRQFGTIPISAGAASRGSLDAVAAALQNGEVVCLFPEGVISRSGHLAEFRRGYEKACAHVDDSVVIVPFYLRGLWGSVFSRSSERLKRRRTVLGREVVVDFGMPMSKTTTADVLKRAVMDLAQSSWQEYADTLPTLGEHWIESAARARNELVLLDTLGTELKGNTALTGSIIMARRFRKHSPEQNIGILLPSSTASVLANFAAALAGKTSVNLNFTASRDAVLSAVLQADIKTIYTSSRFMDKLKGRGTDFTPLQDHCKVVMLEDFRNDTSTAEKLLTMASCMLLPATLLKWLFCARYPNTQTATILFSSGSEGLPKGVLLSHRNIVVNVKQFAEILNARDDDVMLANLPPFHAFGLTVTHFMPLLENIPVVCHADPTDVAGSAMAIAEHRVTILLGTSSFYRLYIRNAKIHPLMLEPLRLVVAGAEKLQDEVRKEFKQKFSKDILEGYGATETAPVASCNMPDQISPDDWKVQTGWKVGSVGPPIPGTSFRIVDPETWAALPTGEAGMILISGAQVMPQYLKNDAKTAQVLRDLDGTRWYVTGDKGYLDADGFLFIQDRYSRFAKIGGEMVGLGTVEAALKQVVDDPDFEVVVVNLPDEKKGEKLVALSTRDLDASTLRDRLTAQGLNALAHPALYFRVTEIPKLGSGKTDFASAKKLALDLVANSSG